MRPVPPALVLAALVALISAAPARAQAPATLQVIVFPGGFNWPIWAAQDRGFFAREGVEVKLTPTPSSVFQLKNLIEGEFDIAMTAIDNVVACQEGQGEAQDALRRPELLRARCRPALSTGA